LSSNIISIQNGDDAPSKGASLAIIPMKWEECNASFSISPRHSHRLSAPLSP